MTWPRIPCALAIRPTSAMSTNGTRLTPGYSAIADLEGHRLAFFLSGRCGERPQRGGGAPLFADHLAQIARPDRQLDHGRALVHRLRYLHIIGSIGERAREHLDDFAHAAHFAASLP